MAKIKLRFLMRKASSLTCSEMNMAKAGTGALRGLFAGASQPWPLRNENFFQFVRALGRCYFLHSQRKVVPTNKQ
jgi:hypothetical protein